MPYRVGRRAFALTLCLTAAAATGAQASTSLAPLASACDGDSDGAAGACIEQVRSLPAAVALQPAPAYRRVISTALASIIASRRAAAGERSVARAAPLSVHRWVADGSAVDAVAPVADATVDDAQTVSSAAAAAPTAADSLTTAVLSRTYLDRVDFGSSTSELAHSVAPGPASGKGAFVHNYRQPMLSSWGDPSAGAAQKLTFTMAVDPVKQNYLTVKLWGSDTHFGVMRLVGASGFAEQLDNNLSSGNGNPPFWGRFHYATTAIPLAMTQGKSTVPLTLVSTGYYYDAGGDRLGQPTRPIYSAFTHTDPYFVPAPGDKTGPAPVQVGTEPPALVDKAAVYRVLKRSRANIHNLDGVPNGFWNPRGTLVNHGTVIPAGTPGAPPEVIGMHLMDGPVTADSVAYFNSQPNAADAWRNQVAGRQFRALDLITMIYLAPPLTDMNGAVLPGYDRYLDPAMLERVIGLLDGLSRAQGGGNGWLGGWDNGCIGHYWGGVTSQPRTSGPWTGSRARQNGGCISFVDTSGLGRAILRIYDNPQAAAAFRAYLDQPIDAELDGRMVKRAYVYQRMLASSNGWLGFGLHALTSDNYFDKFGGTVVQGLIFVQNTYSAQLALRRLQASFPNADADKQPIAPATLRAIARQLVGLDNMVFMRPGDVGWRSVTKAGISETYGSLSSGYDGRYGSAIPSSIGTFAMLTKYDDAMSSTDKAEFAEMTRKTIAAFDNFLYPQHQISTRNDGTVIDTYALGQEDVISHRVPYGPNANGWNLNLQTLAVDPNGTIRSPQARRSLLIAAGRDPNHLISDNSYYTENEAAWKSIAGVDPASVPRLPGEPGAPDFVWADVESGALAMAYKGERLFLNANYNRDQGGVNHYVRVHHITDQIDRAATVRMPFDNTTVQDDGNISGDFQRPWVVRYGRYLVVMNRGTSPHTVTFPPGNGRVTRLRTPGQVSASATASVAAGEYEVFVLPLQNLAGSVRIHHPVATITLGWHGGAPNVDLYRNGAKWATFSNAQTKQVVYQSTKKVTYKVCDAGTDACTAEFSTGPVPSS